MSKEWLPPPNWSIRLLRQQYVLCGGPVDEVLHVDLKDLQLAQQEIRRCQRRSLVPEAVGQLDDVAHLHPVDEDVNLAAVHLVEVEEALIPIEGVETAVAPVAEPLEQLLHCLALLGGSDEIQVTVFALERRLPGTGTVQVDGGPANQLDGDPRLGGSRRNPLRFGDNVGHRDAGLSQLTAPARRR